MPKIKNLAALAAAVQAGRRYARNNPEKAGRYVDQAVSFVDKQTKGKYSGQLDGVANKVRNAAGLPRSTRSTQGFEANAGYGQHQGYGRTTPVTSATTTPSGSVPPVTTPPRVNLDPEPMGDRFPGSKDI